ncbi:MAG: hypothetical protein R3F34_06425 [Planctomycetota bacterium]
MPPALLHVAWALAVTAGGRAVLELLPAGDAGQRRALDPISTLAPSALAGIAAGRIANEAFGATGLAPFSAPATAALVAVVGFVLLLARLGPAGLVPRHVRVEPPLARGLSILGWALWTALGAFFVVGGDVGFAHALLLVWLVEAGLERLRVAPNARRAASCTVAVVAILAGGFDAALVLTSAGPLFAIGWVRRADARDLALAALLAVGAATVAPPVVAALLLALVLATTRRPRLALPTVIAALVAIALLAFLRDSQADEGTSFGVGSWIVGAPLAALLLVVGRATDRGARAPLAA